MYSNLTTNDCSQAFMRCLVSMVANLSLYGSQHPQILYLCDKALAELKTLLAVERAYSFKIIENRLIANNIRQAQSITAERFMSLLTAKEIYYLEISGAIAAPELLTLAKYLGSLTPDCLLEQMPHIQTGQLSNREVPPSTHATTNAIAALAEKNCDKFMTTYTGISKQQQLSATTIAEIVDDFITAFSCHENIMLPLAPLRSMDEYVYVHSTNICLLNLAQAKLLGISGQALKDIGIAALLHDVGKMFIPAEILNKPGRPDEKEWAMIKQHPRLGAEYLLNSPGIPYLAVINAYEHHIGFDGTGYPTSSRPRQLSICSHMTTISDIYDALRTRRSYKEPLSFDRIQKIMQESTGKSLHPQLTHSFLSAMARVDQERP